MNLGISTLVHFMVSILVVFLVWIWYRRTDNAAWIDTAWAGLIGSGALIHAVLAGAQSIHAWGLSLLVLAWSARLSWHLVRRTSGEPEDGRYGMLRDLWSRRHGRQSVPGRFLRFYLFQALLAVALALPAGLVAFDPSTRWTAFQFLALSLGAVSLVGVGMADAQLRRFRLDPGHGSLACRTGLWRYSRHPNYFFEILLWISFALYATPSPYGLWAWLAPASISWFLLRVTGIPWTEAQALKRRGDDYRRYMRTTSPLIPWFQTDRRPIDDTRH